MGDTGLEDPERIFGMGTSFNTGAESEWHGQYRFRPDTSVRLVFGTHQGKCDG